MWRYRLSLLTRFPVAYRYWCQVQNVKCRLSNLLGDNDSYRKRANLFGQTSLYEHWTSLYEHWPSDEFVCFHIAGDRDEHFAQNDCDEDFSTDSC